jgi:hypothetical protein
MILYYAPGGGYGHVCRGLKVLAACEPKETAVIICSPNSVPEETFPCVTLLPIPRNTKEDIAIYRTWLYGRLERLQPERIYIDTFPAGLVGELLYCPDVAAYQLLYVARRMQWSMYAAVARRCPFIFSGAYLVEPLEEPHRLYTVSSSKKCAVLELPQLQSPVPPGPEDFPVQMDRSLPLWGIVHSGVAMEVETLLNYAQQAAGMENRVVQRLLISPEKPEQLSRDVSWMSCFPACKLYPFFNRIFTGCGFNAMHETIPFRKKHRWIPFERRFDNQFWRATYHKRNIR